MSSSTSSDSVFKKCLKVAIGALSLESGFTHTDENVVDLLASVMKQHILQVGRRAQHYCELASRTEPLLNDVALALIDLGDNIDSFPSYAKRSSKTSTVVPPLIAQSTGTPRVLQVGQKRGLPSYIPEHFPSFPDQHTYIRTDTRKSLPNDYQSIREKAASQKRDVERALTRFIAKTGETESLFADDPYAYPLIANKSKTLPYLDALLPKDKELEVQEEEVKQDKNDEEIQNKNDGNNIPITDPAKALPLAQENKEQSNGNPELLDSDSNIDNPYLRPIKMPKLMKSTGKKIKF